MKERIKVRYTNGDYEGEVRYLDPDSLRLYFRPVSGNPALSVPLRTVSSTLWEHPTRGWRLSRCRDEQVGQPNPASTYPDGNPKSVQGAKKYSLRYIPLPALVAVGRAMEDGANKYGPANWRESGVAASVYIDAALRHIFQYFDGRQNDAEDSRVHNLGHAMACLAIIIDAEHNGSLIDDRPFPCLGTDDLLMRT